MSKLVDKEKLMAWLQEQYFKEDISVDRARGYQHTITEIDKGTFDAGKQYNNWEGFVE